MKSRFIPPYYQRDLCLKLQTLKQGDKGVEEYYQELLIGLALCGIRANDDELSARFFGGLNRDPRHSRLQRMDSFFPSVLSCF